MALLLALVVTAGVGEAVVGGGVFAVAGTAEAWTVVDRAAGRGTNTETGRKGKRKRHHPNNKVTQRSLVSWQVKLIFYTSPRLLDTNKRRQRRDGPKS